MALLHRIAFALVKGNNPRMAARILDLTGSEEEFFALPQPVLAARLGFSGTITTDAYRRSLLDKATDEERFVSAGKIRCIYFTDETFPSRLRECDDAPLMLFGLGDADLNAPHMVSVVGTRNATTYGINFINRLVDDLAERIDGLTIVSGLAFGCDIAAHRRALELGIPTVAVVAHGLDILYPAEHRPYAARIARENGAILSDYPHGTPPHRPNFLARNRIVAGMADCIVVAESAAARGGALSTARLGMLYNRDVFALPGRSSDIYSGGCNLLIKRNIAHLIENADDLISAMNWHAHPPEGEQRELFPELSPQQQAIIDYITRNGEAQINSLTAALGLPVGQLMAILVEMEFNGLITPLPGARYRLT